MLRRLENTLRNFRWDERGRLTAAAVCCVLLLLAALLLPLAFRQDAERKEPSPGFSGGEGKAELFISYFYGGSQALSVEKGVPDGNTTAFCESRMAELAEQCLDDQALSVFSPAGREYTTLTAGDTTLRLCRMWMEAKGDWRNWLDVCFDAETGALYYLYLSRECLTNQQLYAGTPHPTAAELGQKLAESAGGTLRHFVQEGSGGLAVVGTDSGALCYEIGTIYYDALIDVRINCV